MSTPSEKPPGPIDLSAYALQKAREHAVTEQHPSASDSHPARSPYAPKRAHERAGSGQHSITSEHDSPDMASDADAAELPADPETAASLQPVLGADSGPQVEPAAKRREEVLTEYDLERLEASLRWLRRQEAATRISRPVQPRPHQRASLDARDRRAGGERLVERFRSPLSLEPERLAPPPSPRRNWRVPLGILAASTFATAAIYYFFAAASAPSPAPAGPQMASFGSRAVMPSSTSSGQAERRLVVARDDEPATSSQDDPFPQPAAPLQAARTSQGETLAMLQPGATAAQAPPPGAALRTLDPADIELLMQQGEQFIAAGDLVTARIVFQRAAEARDATAALALAATYDPIVLSKLGVVGMNADVEKARTWYQKAESLGSTDAARRLRALANR